MIKSTCFQTELIFHQFNGKVERRDGFYKIHTPSNPDYYWGNLLYFLSPPGPGDFTKWPGLFHREFKNHPKVRHMTLAWDGPFERVLSAEENGELAKFLDFGFAKEDCLTLSLDLAQDKILKDCAQLKISKVELRPVLLSEWVEAVDLALRVWPKRAEHSCSEHFVMAQMENYKNMLQAKVGWWMGAFVQGKLAATLGIFFSSEVGRFQMVQVDEQFRQRGLTTALLIETIRKVKVENKTKKLVIIADLDSLPAKIYQGVGFKFVETHQGVCLAPAASVHSQH